MTLKKIIRSRKTGTTQHDEQKKARKKRQLSNNRHLSLTVPTVIAADLRQVMVNEEKSRRS